MTHVFRADILSSETAQLEVVREQIMIQHVRCLTLLATSLSSMVRWFMIITANMYKLTAITSIETDEQICTWRADESQLRLSYLSKILLKPPHDQPLHLPGQPKVTSFSTKAQDVSYIQNFSDDKDL